jgi:hypothetical protein
LKALYKQFKGEEKFLNQFFSLTHFFWVFCRVFSFTNENLKFLMLLMVISHAKIPYAQTHHTPSPLKLGISMAFLYWELDKKRNF